MAAVGIDEHREIVAGRRIRQATLRCDRHQQRRKALATKVGTPTGEDSVYPAEQIGGRIVIRKRAYGVTEIARMPVRLRIASANVGNHDAHTVVAAGKDVDEIAAARHTVRLPVAHDARRRLFLQIGNGHLNYLRRENTRPACLEGGTHSTTQQRYGGSEKSVDPVGVLRESEREYSGDYQQIN